MRLTGPEVISRVEDKAMDLAKALEEFHEHGYTIIPNALSNEHAAAIITALEELTGDEPARIHNEADILGRRDEFLDLIDLPAVLPVVQNLLGDNIWVNHSHYNVNPPNCNENKRDRKTGYGWHRDGGVINQDLPKPAPLLSIKIGFYLSDLSEPGRGQTYVITGSHKSDIRPPPNDELPDTALPVCVAPGSALLFDRRMIHSIRSENLSDITRKVVFIQYAYRWMCAGDAMTVEHLRERCDPVRLQLLGLSPNYNVIDGAAGRSARYHPASNDIPLSGKKTNLIKRLAGGIKRRIAKVLRH